MATASLRLSRRGRPHPAETPGLPGPARFWNVIYLHSVRPVGVGPCAAPSRAPHALAPWDSDGSSPAVNCTASAIKRLAQTPATVLNRLRLFLVGVQTSGSGRVRGQEPGRFHRDHAPGCMRRQRKKGHTVTQQMWDTASAQKGPRTRTAVRGPTAARCGDEPTSQACATRQGSGLP